jgi:hypothetical protein
MTAGLPRAEKQSINLLGKLSEQVFVLNLMMMVRRGL